MSLRARPLGRNDGAEARPCLAWRSGLRPVPRLFAVVLPTERLVKPATTTRFTQGLRPARARSRIRPRHLRRRQRLGRSRRPAGIPSRAVDGDRRRCATAAEVALIRRCGAEMRRHIAHLQRSRARSPGARHQALVVAAYAGTPKSPFPPAIQAHAAAQSTLRRPSAIAASQSAAPIRQATWSRSRQLRRLAGIASTSPRTP